MTSKKIIDKRNQSEVGEYAICFAARLTNGTFDFGHAFVIWYYSDPNGRKTNHRVAGFYPLDGKTYKLAVGVADGNILDDSDTEIANQLIVQISKSSFDRALAVEAGYKNSTYSLGFNDCVTFIASVAGQVPNLKIPNRLMSPSPSLFVSALFEAN